MHVKNQLESKCSFRGKSAKYTYYPGNTIITYHLPSFWVGSQRTLGYSFIMFCRSSGCRSPGKVVPSPSLSLSRSVQACCTVLSSARPGNICSAAFKLELSVMHGPSGHWNAEASFLLSKFDCNYFQPCRSYFSTFKSFLCFCLFFPISPCRVIFLYLFPRNSKNSVIQPSTHIPTQGRRFSPLASLRYKIVWLQCSSVFPAVKSS